MDVAPFEPADVVRYFGKDAIFTDHASATYGGGGLSATSPDSPTASHSKKRLQRVGRQVKLGAGAPSGSSLSLLAPPAPPSPRGGMMAHVAERIALQVGGASQDATTPRQGEGERDDPDTYVKVVQRAVQRRKKILKELTALKSQEEARARTSLTAAAALEKEMKERRLALLPSLQFCTTPKAYIEERLDLLHQDVPLREAFTNELHEKDRERRSASAASVALSVARTNNDASRLSSRLPSTTQERLALARQNLLAQVKEKQDLRNLDAMGTKDKLQRIEEDKAYRKIAAQLTKQWSVIVVAYRTLQVVRQVRWLGYRKKWRMLVVWMAGKKWLHMTRRSLARLRQLRCNLCFRNRIPVIVAQIRERHRAEKLPLIVSFLRAASHATRFSRVLHRFLQLVRFAQRVARRRSLAISLKREALFLTLQSTHKRLRNEGVISQPFSDSLLQLVAGKLLHIERTIVNSDRLASVSQFVSDLEPIDVTETLRQDSFVHGQSLLVQCAVQTVLQNPPLVQATSLIYLAKNFDATKVMGVQNRNRMKRWIAQIYLLVLERRARQDRLRKLEEQIKLKSKDAPLPPLPPSQITKGPGSMVRSPKSPHGGTDEQEMTFAISPNSSGSFGGAGGGGVSPRHGTTSTLHSVPRPPPPGGKLQPTPPPSRGRDGGGANHNSHNNRSGGGKGTNGRLKSVPSILKPHGQGTRPLFKDQLRALFGDISARSYIDRVIEAFDLYHEEYVRVRSSSLQGLTKRLVESTNGKSLYRPIPPATTSNAALRLQKTSAAVLANCSSFPLLEKNEPVVLTVLAQLTPPVMLASKRLLKESNILLLLRALQEEWVAAQKRVVNLDHSVFLTSGAAVGGGGGGPLSRSATPSIRTPDLMTMDGMESSTGGGGKHNSTIEDRLAQSSLLLKKMPRGDDTMNQRIMAEMDLSFLHAFYRRAR